jgi:hypothetical protein
MNFENELKHGKFVVSECLYCKKIVWPPSEFCNQCFKEVNWRNNIQEGKIIEFSKQDDYFFCLSEFESIKIMGKLQSGIPGIGKRVRMAKCGINNNNYFFEFLLI